jgi:hypothetical protein
MGKLIQLNFLFLEVIVHFVDIDGIVDHHCLNFLFLEVIVRFVDIGGIVDHHCINFLFTIPNLK